MIDWNNNGEIDGFDIAITSEVVSSNPPKKATKGRKYRAKGQKPRSKRTGGGMNWKGWLVLGLIVLAVIGGIGFHFISEGLEAEQYHKWEKPIEQAVRGKIDVTDIYDEKLPNLKGKVLWIYLYSEGQTRAPLTEQEFEAVDQVFMDLVDSADTEYVAWAWIQPANKDTWLITILTVCNVESIQANRLQPEIPADCQTQRTATIIPAERLKWLND
jgi:predicted small integral membrane protein